MKLRLHQYISQTGTFRSKAELISAIKDGQVTVDSKTIDDPGFQLKAHKAEVRWKGNLLKLKEHTYIVMNKPHGFLCSRLTETEKKKGRRSVFGIIERDKSMSQSTKQSLFCVGRLDEPTIGLLILTNDGKLANSILNPTAKMPKTYEALLKSPLAEHAKKAIEAGITIQLEENGKVTPYSTLPAKIRRVDKHRVHITITEGKKRQIRKAIEATGNKVVALKRIAIGNLHLTCLNLEEGEYKPVKKSLLEDKALGRDSI